MEPSTSPEKPTRSGSQHSCDSMSNSGGVNSVPGHISEGQLYLLRMVNIFSKPKTNNPQRTILLSLGDITANLSSSSFSKATDEFLDSQGQNGAHSSQRQYELPGRLTNSTKQLSQVAANIPRALDQLPNTENKLHYSANQWK